MPVLVLYRPRNKIHQSHKNNLRGEKTTFLPQIEKESLSFAFLGIENLTFDVRVTKIIFITF